GLATGRYQKASKKLSTKRHKVQKITPNDNETIFAYLARVAARFGAWVWPTVDGTGVVVGGPDYEQPARFALTHKIGQASINNVKNSPVVLDSTAQPTTIIAPGNTPNRTYEKTYYIAYANSPIVTNIDYKQLIPTLGLTHPPKVAPYVTVTDE